MTDDSIRTLAAALRDAHTVTILTGAGVSAESGVPTFRDAQEGLWARYRPQDLASPEAFTRDPDTVWQWYRWRRDLVRGVEPNAGHHALAAMARTLPDLRLVTQNVDGLHQQAGHDGVIEFHGNLFRNRCHADGRRVDIDDATDTAPRCPHCDSRVRPDVVWFGEAIPEQALAAAVAATQSCDVFMAVGTSAEVYPAAGLIDLARESGATVAGINPDPSALSPALDLRIHERAAVALPALLARIQAWHP